MRRRQPRSAQQRLTSRTGSDKHSLEWARLTKSMSRMSGNFKRVMSYLVSYEATRHEMLGGGGSLWVAMAGVEWCCQVVGRGSVRCDLVHFVTPMMCAHCLRIDWRAHPGCALFSGIVGRSGRRRAQSSLGVHQRRPTSDEVTTQSSERIDPRTRAGRGGGGPMR